MGPLMDVRPSDAEDDVRSPEATAPGLERPGARAHIEVLDRDGQIRQSLTVAQWPLRIGRALDNDLVLSDPHVAAHHLHIASTETGLQLHVDETRNGVQLGTLRFAARHAQAFRNEEFTRLRSEHQTKPQCHEDYIDRDGLPLRAVVCLRAYKKLPELYDVSVLVATLDQKQAGVQGRFDAQGLSFANAQRLAKHYLEAYGWAR